MKIRIKKILVGLLFVFLISQAIQPTKNTGNASGPADLNATVPVPANVMAALKRSCYDCHSNQTVYLWYDHITPVNWWISGHVNNGKEELNFSTFKEYSKGRQFESLEAVAQTVETDRMPPKSYLFMHQNAKLSEEEKKQIAAWARATMDEMNRLPDH